MPTAALASVIAIAAGACGTNTSTSVAPTSVRCEVSLPTSSRSIGAAAATVTFQVTTQAECLWSATTADSWISQIAPASGQGPGDVAFQAAANTGPARTGTLTVTDKAFTVNQAGGCTYTIQPTAESVSAEGGSISVAVGSGAGCPWTATSHAAWISVTSGGSGTGDGSVVFAVGAHTGPQRSGTLTIATRTFTVTQASGCYYLISPTQQGFDRNGGPGTVIVTAPPDCAWAAASHEPSWISIVSAPSGIGDGRVDYFVVPAPLVLGTRIGTMTIAGQTFTVTQGN